MLVPLLFVLLFGVYEFSWFFYQQHIVSTRVRDAALSRARRQFVQHGFARLGDRAGYAKISRPPARSAAAGAGPGWSAAMVTPRCTAIDNPIGANGLSAYRGGDVIHVVTVSTRFTESSLGFLGFLHLPALVISVSHSERVIGPG